MVTLAVDAACTLGETPLWHPAEERVFWVDIDAGRLHSYTPETEEHRIVYESPGGEQIGAFTLQDTGGLLLFQTAGSVAWLNNGEPSTVIDGIAGEDGRRFNDVIADPQGRVFCGTMKEGDFSAGRVYRLNTDGTIDRVIEDIGLPNGMGFSPDHSQLYVTDSSANVIYTYDYTAETGEISNPTEFARRDPNDGYFDGLTVDATGAVWSALWGAGAIGKHEPDGSMSRQITIPATNVTSLTFGGDQLETLFITSAVADEDGSDQPGGGLFMVSGVGVGMPELFSAVTMP